MLTCQYNTQTNFRLENDVENDQFIFTVPGGRKGWSRNALDYFSSDVLVISETAEAILKRLSPLPKFDWISENRFKGNTIAEVL